MSTPSFHSSSLINLLLETSYCNSRWKYFAEELVRQFSLHICHIFIVNRRTMGIRFHVDGGVRMDPALAKHYLQEHIDDDPMLLAAMNKPRGLFYSVGTLPEREEILQSKQFREWFAPQGLVDSSSACILSDEDWFGVIFCNRHQDIGEFTVQELNHLNSLLPFIEKAANLSFSNAYLSKDEIRLASVVNTFRIPVAILTETGAVCAMNQGMKDLIEDYNELRIEHNCLRLEDNRLEKMLYIGLMQTAKRVEGFDMMVEEAEHIKIGSRIFLGFQPLLNSYITNEETFSGAMIYAISADLIQQIPAQKLVELFDLSEREASISQRLASGKALKTIADEECISLHTVKWHLKSIFAKTGCSSQIALVNLLNSIPYNP
ncbi:hypothetical protein BTA51_09940 [Hahella sp. CCB-MM4]|uniref:helix-turn-helix transcriptional regulator n=1 Tax=Hahella sp. (strain CCB-MM4) TaxID=1926491 RepID=UPI000B9C56AE|nr:helix-turn-helix transcriptional regulator [Hahella sp. CCB-MM4]OZG73345.1 hypothetical protein BTA51_09940 [Hahella sp. CCB-MM4]